MNETETFKMEEFCSRKLLEIVSEDDGATPDELEAAIRELARRRHYLSELEQLGRLQINRTGQATWQNSPSTDPHPARSTDS